MKFLFFFFFMNNDLIRVVDTFVFGAYIVITCMHLRTSFAISGRN